MCQGLLGALKRLSELQGAGLLLRVQLQLPSGNFENPSPILQPVFLCYLLFHLK